MHGFSTGWRVINTQAREFPSYRYDSCFFEFPLIHRPYY